MKELVLQSSADDDLVMDLFAGNGTSAYAVGFANAIDGGRRRYLVFSTEATDDEPDKNVCRDECAVRLKNAQAVIKQAIKSTRNPQVFGSQLAL